MDLKIYIFQFEMLPNPRNDPPTGLQLHLWWVRKKANSMETRRMKGRENCKTFLRTTKLCTHTTGNNVFSFCMLDI